MKYKYPISLGILILLIGVFVSGIFGLYEYFPHIDKVFHFSGGFALGWFFFILLTPEKFYSKPKQILVVAAATCLVAVFWEYFERLSTLYSAHYFPWLFYWIQGGDLNDTLLDVLAGIIGATTFCLVHFGINKKKSTV